MRANFQQKISRNPKILKVKQIQKIQKNQDKFQKIQKKIFKKIPPKNCQKWSKNLKIWKNLKKSKKISFLQKKF